MEPSANSPTSANAPDLKNESEDLSSSFDLESMDPEQRQKLEEELKNELAKVRNSPKFVCILDRLSDTKLTIYKFDYHTRPRRRSRRCVKSSRPE